jgi:hypothetical protein
MEWTRILGKLTQIEDSTENGAQFGKMGEIEAIRPFMQRRGAVYVIFGPKKVPTAAAAKLC